MLQLKRLVCLLLLRFRCGFLCFGFRLVCRILRFGRFLFFGRFGSLFQIVIRQSDVVPIVVVGSVDFVLVHKSAFPPLWSAGCMSVTCSV